jgi:hypothetical protein
MKGICRDCRLEKEISSGKSGCCQDCWDYRLSLISRLHAGEPIELLKSQLALKKRAARREESERFTNQLVSRPLSS